MNLPTLALRADADPIIGTGHVMRCISLARAWKQRGGNARFITSCNNDAILQRIFKAGAEVTLLPAQHSIADDLAVTLNTIKDNNISWLVSDGYQFDGGYQRRITESACRMMVIDDYVHASYYDADIVLNQNIEAERLPYKRSFESRLLLGTKYVLLSPDFSPWQGLQANVAYNAKNILVTLGGGQAIDMTLVTIMALRKLVTEGTEGLEARILIGAAGGDPRPVLQAAKECGERFQVLRDVSNMPELMDWADLAICAGGTTSWEMAFMGVPMVMVVLAENQAGIAQDLESSGACINMGKYEEIDSNFLAQTVAALISNVEKRKSMSSIGQQLVDGLGCQRVMSVLAEKQFQASV